MARATLYLPKDRGPRENDVGYLIAEARAAGLFVRKNSGHSVELVTTKAQHVLFAGSVPDASAWLRDRR
jgi:hypothetical protein